MWSSYAHCNCSDTGAGGLSSGAHCIASCSELNRKSPPITCPAKIKYATLTPSNLHWECPKTSPIAISQPVSSLTSRINAAERSSPGSILPPGHSQNPACRRFRDDRLIHKIRPCRSRKITRAVNRYGKCQSFFTTLLPFRIDRHNLFNPSPNPSQPDTSKNTPAVITPTQLRRQPACGSLRRHTPYNAPNTKLKRLTAIKYGT